MKIDPRHLPLRRLLAAGEGLLDRLLCLVGAVVFAQAPEFFQQYLQRLGGRLDEARRQLEVFRDVGARVDSLATAEAAIRNASLFTRPFAFARHFDPAIARATLSVFRPALPTTLEGAAYALCGMLVLLAAYHWGVKSLVRRCRRACPPPVATP